MKKLFLGTLVLAGVAPFFYTPAQATFLHAPHDAAHGVDCVDCHEFQLADEAAWGLVKNSADDTVKNFICLKCHGPTGSAPTVAIHSDLTLNGSETWTTECTDCHSPHFQRQIASTTDISEEFLITDIFLVTGTIDAVSPDGNNSIITYTLANAASQWTNPATWSAKTDPDRGLIFVADALNPKGLTFETISADTSTITVLGAVESTLVGKTFGLLYGQFLKNTITTYLGDQKILFFNPYGGFVDTSGSVAPTGVCQVCHANTIYWTNYGSDNTHNPDANCIICHSHTEGFGHGSHSGSGVECGSCHNSGSHLTHLSEAYGPKISCYDCHHSESLPLFADSKTLATTTACDNCHSATSASLAKQYWTAPGSSSGTEGSWAFDMGEQNYCGSCHDTTPGNTEADGLGDAAFNVIGNNSSYGFYVTGHGKAFGNYAPMYFQETTEAGNPAANQGCSDCHLLTSNHFNNSTKRLLAGYENNQANANCNQCHPPGTLATAEPDLYTTATEFEAGAHGGKLCTDCHEVHGAAIGSYPAMAELGSRDLCLSCHYTDNPDNAPVPTEPPAAHAQGSTEACSSCHNPHKPAHGAGASGVGCVECHGHDSGINYDPDMTEPYVAGTIASQGKGSFQSHSTHTEINADDVKGPGIYCDSCHDITNFPYFKSGTDENGDGQYGLTETDVCNTCHSPLGSYNGVDDPVVGVKSLWSTGAYSATDNSTLKPGKEKWCATCHDEVPSLINGVTAPNVIGDEDGDYIYGTGWGYYKTGHGLAAGEVYPSKGGLIEPPLVGGAARAIECNSCHDFSSVHVDGQPRTFDDGESSATDASAYRQGYRLALMAPGQGTGISTREPMLIPWPGNTPNAESAYRLCINCHDSTPFLVNDDPNTNMETDADINLHQYHLTFNIMAYPPDWNGVNSSLITCVVCHNVHGSTSLAMVRDGKLTNREPGLQIWYKNDAVSTFQTNNPDPPSPEDIPLAASDGTVWIGNSSANLCTHCHGNANTVGENRIIFQTPDQGSTLEWTGESGYMTDGVFPDSGTSGKSFSFRVTYTDSNNDAPSSIEIWLDVNDNGLFETDEKYPLAAADIGDSNFTNGKIYFRNHAIINPGDGDIVYRFYATDGGSDATGAPTGNAFITLLNNVPILSWTGSNDFTSDGVTPNNGGNGIIFDFSINYTDSDNEAPAAIQVWLDEDDSGTYEELEKYDLIEADSGDLIYSDGKEYITSRVINFSGDGELTYHFHANDGTDNALGSPLSDSIVTVQSGTNSPPSLAWESSPCRESGVKPSNGAIGGDFEFLVKYSDFEDTCPPGATDIQVWIDLDDSSTYEAGEKFDLSPVDPGDTICSDGKLYSLTLPLALAGDNIINYTFVASDGTDTAIGPPAADHTLTIIDAFKVKSAGGTGWYSTIQSAIDASISGKKLVLVYDGIYNENLSLWNANYSNTTLRSVCGPDTTTISNTGNVVFLQNLSGVTIDGFAITGGSTGIYSNSGSATISNCKIHNNHSPGRGGGLSAGNASSILTVTDSEIFNNTAATDGAAISLNAGFGHAITNTVIRDNTATGGSGGAVFTQNGSVIFTDVTIRDNTANNTGGAVYANGSDTTFRRCTITGNTAVNGSGGVLQNSNSACDAVIENSIVANNQATFAGVTYINAGTLSVINSTFVDNQATTGNGGALYHNGGSSLIRNSIFWDNIASGSGHIAFFNSGSMTLSDSILASGSDGIFTNEPYFSGNITPSKTGYMSDNYPFFADRINGDFHITSSSDAVDNASTLYAPDTDIDGDFRPQGSGDDIGADEYVP